jgi:WhiB family redox-sensing transcriptional regulator
MATKSQLPCRNNDPEIWFPVGTVGMALYQTEHAKTLCHSCPIEEACLAYALSYPETYGVWGGMSEEERRNIIRFNPRWRANTNDGDKSPRKGLDRALASA